MTKRQAVTAQANYWVLSASWGQGTLGRRNRMSISANAISAAALGAVEGCIGESRLSVWGRLRHRERRRFHTDCDVEFALQESPDDNREIVVLHR